MFDIITFGSATWDVFLKLEEKKYQLLDNKKFARNKGLCLSLGSKLDVEEIHLFSGGGGTNAAATFANQHLRTAYCGMIGDDIYGKEIIKELRKLRIDTRFILKTKEKPTNYSVIFNTGSKKDKTVLAYRGASGLLSKRDIPWKKIKRAKWFYLAPLSGQASKLTKDIVDFAYKNKIKIAFNPGNSQLSLPTATLKAILKKIDVLFLNQEEASLLTNIPYKQKGEIFKKLDKMCPGIAIIGSSKGTLVSDNKNLYQTKIPIIKIVDKTGAGDAFTSGFVSGFIKKEDMEYAIQLAIANSASCMQERGAKQGLLKKNEKFRKMKVTKFSLSP